MTRRLLFSTRAKLIFTGGLLLFIICFAGLDLFVTEQAVRQALKTEDAQHQKNETIQDIEEKLDDAVAAYSFASFDASSKTLSALQKKLRELMEQSEILDQLAPGEGFFLKDNMNAALRELDTNSPADLKRSFSYLIDSRRHLYSLDDQLDNQTAVLRQHIQLLVEKNPYRSLWVLLSCLTLILALAIVIVTEIFMPLHKITANLLEAGKYGGHLPIPTFDHPGHDEIGMAQQALNSLSLHIASDFESIRQANLQAGHRLAAIEATRDGIGMVDAAGRLTYANRALFALHGINEKDARQYLGKAWQNLYTAKGRSDLNEFVLPALYKDGFWEGETPIVRKDGEIRQTEMSLTLMEDGSMMGTARDITNRKKMEAEKEELQTLFAQSQKMEAVGRLTGGVAHDFNNLLTIVSGNLELLEDIHPDPQSEARRYISVAQRGLTRGAELTHRLLSFSRKQLLSPRTLDINKFLPDTITLLSRAVGENIDLQFDMQDNLWQANIDPGQMENALLNLAINARDAMESGGTIIIATGNSVLNGHESKSFTVKAGEYVRLSLTDTGLGIPEDIVSHVFEPFFTTKDIGKGTGLGLSMVYGFVKQSGGYIFIDSKEGQGTSISLYFPRIQEEMVAPENSYAVLPVQKIATETILIAEDEEDVLNLSQAMLTRQGYKVLSARNGAEALKFLKSPAIIDLLLTDMVMPGGINGRDLAEEAQILRPGIRTLFVSGYSNDSMPVIAALPHSRFLFKPYTQAKLAQEVRSLLNAPIADL